MSSKEWTYACHSLGLKPKGFIQHFSALIVQGNLMILPNRIFLHIFKLGVRYFLGQRTFQGYCELKVRPTFLQQMPMNWHIFFPSYDVVISLTQLDLK